MIVTISRSAEKELKRLPLRIKLIVISKIKSLAKQPRPHDSKKLTNYSNEYRLRAGDYRILYVINAHKKEVSVRAIAHRKDAYKKIILTSTSSSNLKSSFHTLFSHYIGLDNRICGNYFNTPPKTYTIIRHITTPALFLA